MAYSETDLVQADGHVLQGTRHVLRQRQLLRRLGDHGHDTSMAEDILMQFETTLAYQVAHRDQIRAELKRSEG